MGLLLFLFIPLSVSRFVFSLCGLVVLIAGVMMLLDNLRGHKQLNEPKDPNIIDAL